MDWNFIKEYAPMYGEAAVLTAKIAAIGIFFSIITGIVCSVVRYCRIPILKQISGLYIELSRNTPLLIQLFFLYFGLPKIGIVLDSELCGIIGLSFLGGGYMAEAFRSGLESVEKKQYESGLCLGMSSGQILRFVVIPQAISVSVPAVCSNIIFLIKETSVFSAVALADLMFVAKDLIGLYYKTDEALFMLVMSYLLLLLPISLISAAVERRVRYAGYGH